MPSGRPRQVNLGSAETETEMKNSRDLGRDRDRDLLLRNTNAKNVLHKLRTIFQNDAI